MTLTEFLLARIDEAERVPCGFDAIRMDPPGMELVAPRRVVAECAAKRRIVDRIIDGCGHGIDVGGGRRIYPGGWCLDYCDLILRDLAAVYADHPDYRDEWKP